MFCINCGNQLVDGAKFCLNCGQRIIIDTPESVRVNLHEENRNESKENSDNGDDVVRNIYDDENKNTEGGNTLESEQFRSKMIVPTFRKYFNKGNVYGKRIFIFGTSILHEEIIKVLKMEFNYEADETLLLAFDSRKFFEEGFLLTNKRFRWKDGMVGSHSWELDKIYDINKEKRILANVMYFITNRNEVSEDIFLTGIDNVHEFVDCFQAFIKEINAYKEDGTQNKDNLGNQEKLPKDAFKMQVRDVFIIPKRGIVVTGIIELGALEINDAVIICGTHGKQKEARVFGIELDGELVKRAEIGETVGILFDCSIIQEDVEQGDYIVKREIDILNNRGMIPVHKSIEHTDISEIVNSAFAKFFVDMNTFAGDKIMYLVNSQNNSNYREYLNLLKQKFEISNNEMLLAAYDHRGFYDDGFLITTKRIIWRYKEIFSGEWELSDISEIEARSYMMSPTIVLINNRKGVYSSDIVLTFLKNREKFVFRLQLFIDEINKKNRKPDEIIDASLRCAVYSIDKLKCIVYTILRRDRLEAQYIANQDDQFAEKYFYHAYENYKIPEETQIYLLVSAVECCKKGYAVCDDGIYYLFNDGNGYIEWNEIKNKPIKKIDKHNVAVGETTFYLDEAVDQQIEILNNIKDVVNWNWNTAFSLIKAKQHNMDIHTDEEVNVIHEGNIIVDNSQNDKREFILESIPLEASVDYSQIVKKTINIDLVKFNDGKSLRIDKQIIDFAETLNISKTEKIFWIEADNKKATSAKGFAVCEGGFRYKNASNEIGFIVWRDFAITEIKLDKIDRHIYVGNNRFYFYFERKKSIMCLLLEIQKIIREFYGLEANDVRESDEQEFDENMIADIDVDSKVDEIVLRADNYSSISEELSLICAFCGNKIKSGKKFCSKCGKPILSNCEAAILCPECGNVIKNGKKFCNKCGMPINTKEGD